MFHVCTAQIVVCYSHSAFVLITIGKSSLLYGSDSWSQKTCDTELRLVLTVL